MTEAEMKQGHDGPEQAVGHADPSTRLKKANGGEITVGELRSRVRTVEPGIIAFDEIDNGTPETLAVTGATIVELAKANRGPFAVIVVLGEPEGGMTAEYRAFIPEMFQGLGASHIGIVLNANPIVRVLTKFLARRMGLNVTIHVDLPSAIATARATIARAPS